jgi:Zn-finger nucleic acid-binding protein
VTCAGCGNETTPLSLDGHYGRGLTIDVCHACNGVWFDGHEDLHLAPTGVVALFEAMGQAAARARTAMANRKVCPRCQTGLLRAHDRVRDTHYEFFRCTQGHGRFMTFAAFLRARHFVRDLSPAEVRELRVRVAVIKCVNCGASVDVRAHSACAFCQSPVAVIDEGQLTRTLAELEAAAAKRGSVDPSWPLRAAQARRHTEAVFAELNRGGGASPSIDLVEAGISLFADVLKTLRR